MNMKKILIVMVSVLLILSLCSCESEDKNKDSDVIENTSEINVFDVEYSENTDGTYTCRGKIYKYKVEVSGIEGENEATFIVLTNDKDIKFETISKSLISSMPDTSEPQFVILGWY